MRMFDDANVRQPVLTVTPATGPASEKIDLIYVVGCGRSGSTLLDLVLGAHPLVVSIGEAWYHARWQANNFACTCGASFRECEFWRAVTDRLRQQKAEVTITPVTSRYEKWLSLLQLTTGIKLLSHERIRDYALASYLFFKAVQEISGKPIVLDSSKNPLRLLYLCLSGYFKIKIIHLVRDGRAYVNSTSKRVQMPAQGGAWSSPQNAWRSSWRWILTNSLSRLVCLRLQEIPSRLVKYEEFAAEPTATTQRLCEFLNLEYSPDLLNDSNRTAHNICGSRWRYQGRRVIRLDEFWRTELSTSQLLIFTLLGQRLNHKFGYQ